MMSLLYTATLQTLYMVFIATLITIFVGLPLGILLHLTAPLAIWERKGLYGILSAIVNVMRSFPFIILMIFIMPLTRVIVGSAIGTNAAIVPLALAAIPFFGRIVETAFSEIPKGITEAGLAMGATLPQLVWHCLLPEALPSIIQGVTLTLINLIGYSAMAGTIGGGGLGDLAIRYGYQRFKLDIMLATIVILIVLVQGIQVLGNLTARQFNQKK